MRDVNGRVLSIDRPALVYGTAEYWKQRYFDCEEAKSRLTVAAIAGWALLVVAGGCLGTVLAFK